MSGHSKWSTIKRKKGALDAKRSKLFSRVVKEIMIAVKEGGSSEADANPRLRLAIDSAKRVNMPKDNIQRAISRANKDAVNLSEFTFEGYAIKGVAIFVECMSDNNNRTVANVRAIFKKYGGSLGTNGSLAFLFERKGVISIPKDDLDIEELGLELIDIGAEDIDVEGDNILITTTFEDFDKVQKRLKKMDIEIESAELQRVANDTKKLPIKEAKKVLDMINAFEEEEDVQNVFHNLEMTDELQEFLEEE